MIFQSKLTLYFTNNLKSGNFEKILDFSANLCNVKGASNFAQKFALDVIRKNANFNLSCPFKKVTKLN